MRILILGGGIGGLAFAAALESKGIDYLILEQSAALTEVGAGIQIAANGSQILEKIGLEDNLRSIAVAPREYSLRDLQTDQQLLRSPLGGDAAKFWGGTMYNVHRADLVKLLASVIPAGKLKLGVKGVKFEVNADRVILTDERNDTYSGTVLVGADGIHSMVRKQLFGEDDIHFSKILMWRALLDVDDVRGIDLPESGNYWFGPGRTLITYWVRPSRTYSILASVPADEVHRESWYDSGDIQDLFSSFPEDEVADRPYRMLRAIKHGFITGMYYRNPIPHWTTGPVTLLGDGAHPMVPFLAQGACQSIEDGWTLAEMLERYGAGREEDALEEYERRRQPRASRIQAAARTMVQLTHERDRQRLAVRNGYWRGLQKIDPMTESIWGSTWGYKVADALARPAADVVGVSLIKEGYKLNRPESCRAFDMWRTAFTAEDRARSYDGLREGYERFLSTAFPLADDVTKVEQNFGHVRVLKVETKDVARTEPTSIILHFHGGGYIIGSAESSVEYASRLSRALHRPCVTVDYRLAPEHPYPAAFDDAIDAYRYLLQTGYKGRDIILSGESAGGGLALATALGIRVAGLDTPAGVIAVCPMTDLSLTSASIQSRRGEDPAASHEDLRFMAAAYTQGHEPRDPFVSPLFGDLAGLPPTFVAVTTSESLTDDTVRFIAEAKKFNLSITQLLVNDSVHVFPLFPFLPETRQFLDGISQWAGSL